MDSETIIIADDHPVFRDGLRSLLQQGMPSATVATAETLDEAITIARQCNPAPSLFVLDLFFARRSIKDALPALRREFSRASIVVLSMADDQATIDGVLACGVNGFISKAVSPQALADAIRAVCQGEIVVELPDFDRVPSIRLTERQVAVLQLIADGKSNKEIAMALGISPFTVRIHVSAMFRALGVGSRTAAISKGISEGIVQPSG